MNKTMLKLVWALTAIVLLIGLVQVGRVYQATHSSDQMILNRKVK